MNLQEITTRHQTLETNIKNAFENLKSQGFKPMKLIKIVKSGEMDFKALGLPENFFEELAEYQALSATLRTVAEKVAAKMEASNA